MNSTQYLNDSQIDGLKAGINDIMQGLLTLNKVLTMIQAPEDHKYPRESVKHDSHVRYWEEQDPAKQKQEAILTGREQK